jgi:4-diphosphocytidyl-2-C-methyl-D-erythritol kinase
MKEITELAYAKINLSLDITGKRENGYHEIDGVMQSVTLCDRVTVRAERAENTEISLAAKGNDEMPLNEKNLAYRAAQIYTQALKINARIEIFLEKSIPMAGGLAGGSSDAAAVLRALNRIFESPLDTGELCALGSKLGADVPFCIRGGAMRTQGIGDLLAPLPSMPRCSILIARRGEGVSTPWAYGELDRRYDDFSEGTERPNSNLPALLSALEQGDLVGVCRNSYNIFEYTVRSVRPDVGFLIEQMQNGGALLARMSGSGPSVFGVFEREGDAERVRRALTDAGAVAFVCEPI